MLIIKKNRIKRKNEEKNMIKEFINNELKLNKN